MNMRYETSDNPQRVFEEIRAIMDKTGARKVIRRDGMIYLDDSHEPWDGVSKVQKNQPPNKVDLLLIGV